MAIIFTTPQTEFPIGDVPAGKGFATFVPMTVQAPANTVLSVATGDLLNASLEVLGWVLPGSDYRGGASVTLPATAPLGVAVSVVVRAKTDLLFSLPPDFSTKFNVHAAAAGEGNDSPEIEVKGTIVDPDEHRAAIDLALDRSQFMDLTTISRVKLACGRLLDFMTDEDWLGIAAFTSSVGRKLEVKQLTEQHRNDAETYLALYKKTNGESSVFKVSKSSVDDLNALPEVCDCAPQGRALFLMTMGVESVGGYSPPAPSSTFRFALALAPDPGVIPDVTEDYFPVGDISTPNDMFRLEEYLLQSLAEMSNLDQLLDPVGTLSGSQAVKIPFQVADTESNVRIVLLVDNPELVHLSLEIGNEDVPILTFPGASLKRGKGSIEFALDRTVLEQDAEDEEPCKPRKRDHRSKPKEPKQPQFRPAPSSTWRAVLTLSKTGLALGGRLKPVPYALLVFAESDLRFSANVHLDNPRVGGTAFLSAWLTEHRAPVTGKRVRVWAEVTYPDKGVTTVELCESGEGRFEAQVRITRPGAYRYRIFAAGTTFRGKPFKRELTRATFSRSGSRHECVPCAPPHTYQPSKAPYGRLAAPAEVDEELDEADADVDVDRELAKPTRRGGKSGQLGLALGKVLEALRLAKDALR